MTLPVPSCIAGISETKDLADGLLLPVDPSSVGAPLALGAAEVRVAFAGEVLAGLGINSCPRWFIVCHFIGNHLGAFPVYAYLTRDLVSLAAISVGSVHVCRSLLGGQGREPDGWLALPKSGSRCTCPAVIQKPSWVPGLRHGLVQQHRLPV